MYFFFYPKSKEINNVHPCRPMRPGSLKSTESSHFHRNSLYLSLHPLVVCVQSDAAEICKNKTTALIIQQKENSSFLKCFKLFKSREQF